MLETPSLIPCRSLFSNPKSLLGKMVESNIYVLAKFALAKEIIFPFFFLKKWWDKFFPFFGKFGPYLCIYKRRGWTR